MNLVSSSKSIARLVVTAAVLAGFLAADGAAAADSLYKRLGGYDAIAGFVDTAFPRVAAHPQLNHLFRGHSKDSQFRQRQLIIDALCAAAGGPCIYIGRPLKPVHVGLGITATQWNAFMGIMRATADEKRFRDADEKEFLELFSKQFRPVVVEN